MGSTVIGRIPKDGDRAAVLGTLSYLDGKTVVPIYGDPATGALLTSIVSGGGGGTQYASGTTTPNPITGNALIFDNSGTLEDVSVANPLPVAATFSGSITSSPTFAMTPGSSPTAAYGLIDSSYRPVVVGAGTAGTPTGGVLSIQGVTSGTAVPISAPSLPLPTGASTSALQTTGNTSLATIATNTTNAGTPVVSGAVTANAGTNLNTSLLALDTSVDGILIAQGATTSGQTGPLMQGSVTTTAPTYTAGEVLPLNLTVNGSLRTSVTSIPALVAGSAIIGNVRIDQTTPGTTNGVQVNAALPAGTNAIGSITNTSFTATQTTGTNLHTVVDSGTITAVTAITNALPAGTNGIGNVGTVSAVINVGQQTVNTTAVQISATSTVPTNGIIIQALSTNGASIFVGGSGVTTSTGFELTKGQSMSFTANLNTLYIISATSTTDKVCYNVE